MSEKTARRRLDDPAFVSQLRAIQADMVARTSMAMTAASEAAIGALADLLDSSVPPTVRLGAARAVIELGSRLRDDHDVLVRLADLERVMAEAAR